VRTWRGDARFQSGSDTSAQCSSSGKPRRRYHHKLLLVRSPPLLTGPSPGSDRAGLGDSRRAHSTRKHAALRHKKWAYLSGGRRTKSGATRAAPPRGRLDRTKPSRSAIPSSPSRVSIDETLPWRASLCVWLKI